MGSQECAGKILRPFLDSWKNSLYNYHRFLVEMLVGCLKAQLCNFETFLLLWFIREDQGMLLLLCTSTDLYSFKKLTVPTPWIVEYILSLPFTRKLESMLSNFHVKIVFPFFLFSIFFPEKTNIDLYLIFTITCIWYVTQR